MRRQAIKDTIGVVAAVEGDRVSCELGVGRSNRNYDEDGEYDRAFQTIVLPALIRHSTLAVCS
jgi:hypothetical protein